MEELEKRMTALELLIKTHENIKNEIESDLQELVVLLVQMNNTINQISNEVSLIYEEN